MFKTNNMKRHPEALAEGSMDSSRSFRMTQCETGRSMIEMLGVLAIIGVLSVGGIAGYTSAMRSYKANEIINATSMLFMEGLASNVGEGTSPMDLDSNMLPSGCKGIHYKGDKATLTVNIEDETICKQVKTKLGDKAGDCTAVTGGGTGYTLTVTLGEATTRSAEELEGLPCQTNDDCSTGRPGDQMACVDMGDGNVCSCMAYTCGERCIPVDCSITNKEDCLDGGYSSDICDEVFGQ